jgi:hypothetical protein
MHVNLRFNPVMQWYLIFSSKDLPSRGQMQVEKATIPRARIIAIHHQLRSHGGERSMRNTFQALNFRRINFLVEN